MISDDDTPDSRYPIDLFVSYDKLYLCHHAFLSVVIIDFVPQTYAEAVKHEVGVML